MNMDNLNYYEILGVSVHASIDEITAAKNALAKIYHPDANIKNGIDTTAQMQSILEAYRILSDTSARAEYDRKLTGNRPAMQTFDLRKSDNAADDAEPTFLTYWRASNDLFDIVSKSRELYHEHDRESHMSQLALQAIRHIMILRGARIPERYWHPDVMNWLLFAWFKNQNYTISYLLTLYDDYSKTERGRIDKLRIKTKTIRYQRSVRRLMQY